MFKDKVCLVIGGTSGIGLAAVTALAKEGGKVVVVGRNKEKWLKASEGLDTSKVDFFSCDVAQYSTVHQLFVKIEEKYNQLDCVFNNAGITAKYGRIVDVEVDNWMNVVNTNLNGLFFCLQAELALMVKNQSPGSIVNMSSCAGVLPIRGQAAYVASKSAINTLTKVAAMEYADRAHNIRINAIAPGPIQGGMNTEEALRSKPENTKRKIGVTAMKRFGTADEVVNLVLWLLSEASSYMTGSILPVDGGYSAGKLD